MNEPWGEAVRRCRQAREYHHAFTVAGKEVELDAIRQLMDLGFGVREIARLTHIPRSTVSRLCRDLSEANRQVAAERAESDSKILEFARSTIRRSE